MIINTISIPANIKYIFANAGIKLNKQQIRQLKTNCAHVLILKLKI